MGKALRVRYYPFMSSLVARCLILSLTLFNFGVGDSEILSVVVRRLGQCEVQKPFDVDLL
jgi:hypothetical protein